MTQINRMDSIGQRLKEERKRLGYNQTDFATHGGVQKNAQSNYESNARMPDASYLAAIAAVGADIAYILTGTVGAASLSAEEHFFLSGYRRLDARGRAGLRALVDGMRPEPAAAQRVSVKGDVGQLVEGDLQVSAPLTINMGKKRKN